ncbi:MAG: hypothetical protein HY791_21870 [Deltaproteobacteria bacterium]|nr:hypothetical protein [Deltaproteobacteria bacterium]
MIDLFEDLARAVDQHLDRLGGAQAELPEAAALAISESSLLGALRPFEVLRWAISADLPPQEADNEYGEPTFTMIRTERYRIELIFWVDGAARVHEHVAYGVFHPLSGRRLHIRYLLDESEARSAGTVRCKLDTAGVELVGPGDTRSIFPGRRMIHELFFLERPSVTLSVRGLPVEPPPRYAFANGVLAFDLAHPRVDMRRRAAAFALLARLQPPERLEVAEEWLRVADMLSARMLLSTLEGSIPLPAKEHLLGLVRNKHGPWLDEVMAAEAAESDRDALESFAFSLDDPTLRLVPGLIWSGANAEESLAAARKAVDVPHEDARAWLVSATERAMAARSLQGVLTTVDPIYGKLSRFLKLLSK